MGRHSTYISEITNTLRTLRHKKGLSKFTIDINHPGHVHLFRNLITELQKQGHSVSISCRKTTLILWLLEKYHFSYVVHGSKTRVIVLKYFYQIRHIVKSYFHLKKTGAEIGLGVSITLPILSGFSKIRSIAFDDDDRKITPVFAFAASLADTLLTPAALANDKRGNNQICYSGYHELAYLHPNRFTPDPEVLNKLGVNKDEIFFLLRFNSFHAHHDMGEKGMTFRQKLHLINHMEKYGKIFISSEYGIDPEFSKYILTCGPDEIHSVLYYAAMYIGESQTMTSEAAVLGTPAIKCNTFAGRLSVPNELEHKYSLCYSFNTNEFEKMLSEIDSLMQIRDLKTVWQQRRFAMLENMIDVTAFFAWFVGNYPESRNIMLENPEYQNRFKHTIRHY